MNTPTPDPHLDTVLRRFLADHHSWTRTLRSETVMQALGLNDSRPEARAVFAIHYGAHRIEQGPTEPDTGTGAANVLLGLYTCLTGILEYVALIGITPSELADYTRTTIADADQQETSTCTCPDCGTGMGPEEHDLVPGQRNHTPGLCPDCAAGQEAGL